MEQSPLCSFGANQTIRYIVEEWKNTKFEGGVGKLYENRTATTNWIMSLNIAIIINFLVIVKFKF
jgi:hypothetical protein